LIAIWYKFLRCDFRAIRHDPDANMAITFKKAENNGFAGSAPAYDSFYPASA